MASEKDLAVRKVQKKITLVPPDGGWGWMVLIGTAISNVRMQTFIFSLNTQGR